MKMACIYSSKTGNTRMVAEAVHRAMPEGSALCAVESAPSPADYDFLALCYWVDRGNADAQSLRYMEQVSGKKVGVFGTLGAYPDSDHGRDVVANVARQLDGNDILGSFLCQGKIDPKLLEAMARIPGHEMTEERRARIEEAKKHPDTQDLDNARRALADMLERLTEDVHA